MTTELTLPQRAAVALGSSKTEQDLQSLVNTAKSFVAITNAAGRADCHSRLMALKNARIDITKTGKAAREDAQAFSSAVIAEEKRLIAIVADEENRLLVLREEWDSEQEEIAATKRKAEQDRVDAIQRKIDAIVATPNHTVPIDSNEIQRRIQALSAQAIELDEYQELTGKAQVAKDGALQVLVKMLNDRLELEAEQQRLEVARQKAAEELRQQQEALAIQQEEQARIAKEQADRQAELDRQAAELQKQRNDAVAALMAEQERHSNRITAEELQAKIAAAPEPTSAPAQVDLSEVVAGGFGGREPDDDSRRFDAGPNQTRHLMAEEVTRQAVCDAIADTLGDAYDCTRHWSAWGYGTMSQDDFIAVAEQDERLAELADAAIKAMPLYAAAEQMLAALKCLSFAAQTTGGTAGRDEGLCAAIAQASAVIAAATGEEVAG